MCRFVIYKGTEPVQLSHVRFLLSYFLTCSCSHLLAYAYGRTLILNPSELQPTLGNVQLLTKPCHSIINQAFNSRLRVDLRNPVNGDGFGVGAYGIQFRYHLNISVGSYPFRNRLVWLCLWRRTWAAALYIHFRHTGMPQRITLSVYYWWKWITNSLA